MSESLIQLGDDIKEMPFAGGPPNLYAEISRDATARLELEGRDKEVEEVLRKAHGRSLLSKG
jgi:hypothetical protein